MYMYVDVRFTDLQHHWVSIFLRDSGAIEVIYIYIIDSDV